MNKKKNKPNIQRNIQVVRGLSNLWDYLLEPMRGWTKAFDPPTLREAMKKARGMEFAAPKSKSLHKEIPSSRNENPQQSDKKKESTPTTDEET